RWRTRACSPWLGTVVRPPYVDAADPLARVAGRAQGVGQVGLIEAGMKRSEREPERTVVDVPELEAADGQECRARVRACAAPDACQGIAEDGIGPHLFAAVIEDHTVHLPRAMDSDRQRLFDVGRA